MSDVVYPEFKSETRRWMFWLARIFGKRICGGIYEWRGRLYIVGEWRI